MHTTINLTGGRQRGITLVELMVALAIGSFLIIGAVQIYSQSRQAFVINESIARVQETAQFALDTIEADLRMASNWGRTSRALSIDGRTMIGSPNPNGLAVPLDCGEDWSIELGTPVDGFDNVVGGNNIALPCPPDDTGQANSDVLTVRRAPSTRCRCRPAACRCRRHASRARSSTTAMSRRSSIPRRRQHIT